MPSRTHRRVYIATQALLYTNQECVKEVAQQKITVTFKDFELFFALITMFSFRLAVPQYTNIIDNHDN